MYTDAYLSCKNGTGCFIYLLTNFNLETCNPFFSGLSSIPVVGSHHRAQVTWFVTPAQRTTLKSSPGKWSHHYASPSFGFAMFEIVKSEPKLVWTVRCVPLRYDGKRNTDKTTAKDSWRVVP